MNQRRRLCERLENDLGSHRVQILQGCLGVGKTFFLQAWGKAFVGAHPTCNLRSFVVDEPAGVDGKFIFESAKKDDQAGTPVLYLVDNIERLNNFSVFINSINSLANISCVSTSDVDIRVSKSVERTLFADRCAFLDFGPLSYEDYLGLVGLETNPKKTVSSYLSSGGIPSVLLSADPKEAVLALREKILLFVQTTFHLNDYVLLVRLFNSYCRFGGFPKNEFSRELRPDELELSYNTLLKYTRALSACFAISRLPRINADNFTPLAKAPAYLPLDSCFDPGGIPFGLRLIDEAEISLFNRLVADGYRVGVSIVNRQPFKEGKYSFEQIENGFLVSKDSHTWFVIFSWDDGTSGKKALKELRNSFPKIIVLLADIPNQLTSEGFFMVSLSSFLHDGLEVIKGII